MIKRVIAVLTALILISAAEGCNISDGPDAPYATDPQESVTQGTGTGNKDPENGSEGASPGSPSEASELPSEEPLPTASEPGEPGPGETEPGLADSTEEPTGGGDTVVSRSVRVDTFSFDEEMLRFVETKEKGNYMVSPLSFRYALGMLTAGAGGETRRELLAAMGLDSEKELEEYIKRFNAFSEGFNAKVKKDTERYESLDEAGREYMTKPCGALRVADSVWKRAGIPAFTDEFKLKMGLYDAEMRDFTTDKVISEVNAWADDKTEGMIPELLPEDYDTESLAVILINALYFKNSWADTFYDAGKLPFSTADGGSTEKQFMSAELKCRYYKDADTELAEIPMANSVTALFVIGSVEGLETKLGKARTMTVNVFLPRFEIETALVSQELCDLLKSLGVKSAFGGGADFTGMLKDHPVVVDDIIQKTKIKLDETGIEAAAVTAVMTNDEVMPDPEEIPEFRADRPFRFYIRTGASEWTEGSGTVMFAGRLCE